MKEETMNNKDWDTLIDLFDGTRTFGNIQNKKNNEPTKTKQYFSNVIRFKKIQKIYLTN
jgi:hypothetical protein